VATVLAIASFGVGCSFSSSLDGAECDREGEISEDETRRCENGFWVRTDASESAVDSGEPGGDTAPGLETGADGCGVLSVWYRDEDEDEFGTENEKVEACKSPPGYVGEKGDCDDGDANRHPEVAEHCNEIDDNCNGETDEGILEPTCSADHDGRGACKLATKSCENGEWTDCTGGTEPDDEECNGVDDNCDGETDEGLVKDCGIDLGVCEFGTMACNNAEWGDCMNAIPRKQDEVCNDKDSNCDGKTDNGTCKDIGTDCSADWECATENCKSPSSSPDKKCRQTIFVTRMKTNGNFGGFMGGDFKCETAAGSGGIGKATSWKAFLSNDNKTAEERIDYRYPLYNTNGSVVAVNAEEFWTKGGVHLQHPIQYDAAGNAYTTDVWTGTKASSDSDDTCENNGAWTDGTSNENGTYGVSDRTGRTWIKEGKKKCKKRAALYCVQVPSP